VVGGRGSSLLHWPRVLGDCHGADQLSVVRLVLARPLSRRSASVPPMKTPYRVPVSVQHTF
jgi:hypothetical protein